MASGILFPQVDEDVAVEAAADRQVLAVVAGMHRRRIEHGLAIDLQEHMVASLLRIDAAQAQDLDLVVQRPGARAGDLEADDAVRMAAVDVVGPLAHAGPGTIDPKAAEQVVAAHVLLDRYKLMGEHN